MVHGDPGDHNLGFVKYGAPYQGWDNHRVCRGDHHVGIDIYRVLEAGAILILSLIWSIEL